MNTRIRESEQARHQGPSLLDEVLEQRMLLYALAAGATLAGASAAQAKVVFTPSHAVLTTSRQGSSLGIDLNHDGVIDFTIVESFEAYSHTYTLKALGAQPSSLIATKEMEAVALKRGNSIGNRATHFRTSGFMCTTGNGPFLNTKERFLGVQFVINGEVHYGWIGFRSVTKDLTATLGGWAYETEPNTPIIAGEKGDADSDSSALQAGPTSLELLAMGHTTIADRQRRIAAQVES